MYSICIFRTLASPLANFLPSSSSHACFSLCIVRPALSVSASGVFAAVSWTDGRKTDGRTRCCTSHTYGGSQWLLSYVSSEWGSNTKDSGGGGGIAEGCRIIKASLSVACMLAHTANI